ncbi:UDP-N-acetylglucosamine 2-epimerase [Methanobacterium paludis]|uniref:UDP-N-acetyl-D-glucosamine 2-epimerase, UDP-hydrolysing n=1 Tax=Methanobacterium paludis (strain DSM 25820 / JCM 18151 / SWAN1) TaxID=868131 RepID=F6D704_METPW|nr:UDP-N-acetylglucosamine 2-epimerase [Methanobacterium paludis]AEG18371.1 UDP-N-acetyl-D-glucosamine 2-epimerase, UDP-hydrolysing [Methanobacterium paludis]
MTRKILYITGTRADYGLMRSVLFEIDKNPEMELELAVTGMHLMNEFGRTINEIRKDEFKIHELNAVFEEDDKFSMAKFVGKLIELLTDLVKKIKPDIILLLGDRGEMLAGAIVGAYLNIPTAHLHGGEITSTVDEYARHAITKLVNIHLPATEKSAERIINMGENPDHVFVVGAPGLDAILNIDMIKKDQLALKYDLNLSRPIILVLQHPVTLESEKSSKQMLETLKAICDLKYQTILIYPNADAGGREIIKLIEKCEKLPFVKTFMNIQRKDYLILMNVASVLVGNSSSGIIESPSFKLPVINIGSRQKGRERASNVIDVDYNVKEIKNAIKKALYDENFKTQLNKCENPYGKGKTSLKVTEILSKITLDKELLEKRLNL